MITWHVPKELLDAKFVVDLTSILDPSEYAWFVVYGFRTREEQAALYAIWLKWLEDNPQADPASGPRAAPPGSSAHEGAGIPGTGEAADLQVLVDGKVNWQYKGPVWRWLVDTVKAHPRLHSLDAIGDTDHVEAVNWRVMAQAAKGGTS